MSTDAPTQILTLNSSLLSVEFLEDLAQLGALAELLQRELGVAFGVAVAHDHVHVAADTLGTEAGLGEAGGHAEEVDDTVVLGAEHSGHLLVGNVDAVDGDVGHLAVGEALDELIDLHGSHAGGTLHDVAEAEVLDALGALGAVGDTDDLAGHADALLGLIAAEHAALAAGAEDDDRLAILAQLGGLGGSTGHVECAQGELLGHIGRNLGIDAALEEDGLTLDVDLVDLGTDLQNLVDAERSEAQAHEGGDAVALLEVDLALQGVTNLLDLAKEHTARTSATVAVLALELHIEEHLFLHLFEDLLLAGAFAGLLLGIVVDVSERSAVDVQRLSSMLLSSLLAG